MLYTTVTNQKHKIQGVLRTYLRNDPFPVFLFGNLHTKVENMGIGGEDTHYVDMQHVMSNRIQIIKWTGLPDFSILIFQ